MYNGYIIYTAIVAVILLCAALLLDIRAEKLLDMIRDNKGPENVVKKYYNAVTFSRICWYILAAFAASMLINYFLT